MFGKHQTRQYVRPVNITVGTGTLLSGLNLPISVDVIVDYDSIASVPVTWSLTSTPAYNPDIEGVYVFTWTLTVSGGLSNPDSLSARAVITVNNSDVNYVTVLTDTKILTGLAAIST